MVKIKHCASILANYHPMNQLHKTDILILGAGIGGYEAYRSLAKLLKHHGLNKKITVIDRNNYFTFTPMLHEAATGSVEPTHCAIPLRALIKTQHEFIRTDIQKICPEKKCIETDVGTIEYEYIIVALGSKINFFNTPGAAEYTYNVRTLTAAMKLQQAFINLLESQQKNIRLAIVGGAYTGIEIAGQFSHFAKTDIAKLYPTKTVEINLIQSNNDILPTSTSKIRKYIREHLEKENVIIKLNSLVTEVSPTAVILKDKTEIATDLVIWTAGFENTAASYLPDSACERGRIPVNEFLYNTTHPTMYAIGDIMCAMDPNTKLIYPQLGEAAHKEGEYVARQIVTQLIGKKLTEPFHFKSFGTIIPLGNWQAVAQIGPITIYGPLAWWIRRTAYILFFPGFVRKLKIVIDWTLHSFGHRYIIDLGGKRGDY